MLAQPTAADGTCLQPLWSIESGPGPDLLSLDVSLVHHGAIPASLLSRTREQNYLEAACHRPLANGNLTASHTPPPLSRIVGACSLLDHARSYRAGEV